MADDPDWEFEKLYKYYPAVVSLLREAGFDLDEARDLAQRVFTRVYEHMETYRGESRLAFLQQVARRLAYNEIRDRAAAKRSGIHVPTDDILDLSDPRIVAADVALVRKENADRLYRAIDQLPAGERRLIMLQLAGESYREIAAATGIKESVLKSRFHAIRQRLRELLDGEDVEGIGDNNDH